MARLQKKRTQGSTISEQQNASNEERKRSLFGLAFRRRPASRGSTSEPATAPIIPKEPMPNLRLETHPSSMRRYQSEDSQQDTPYASPDTFSQFSHANSTLTTATSATTVFTQDSGSTIFVAPEKVPDLLVTANERLSDRPKAKFVAARNDLSAAITGEKVLHSLVDFDEQNFDSIEHIDLSEHHLLGKLDTKTWNQIIAYLPRLDAANFVFATRKIRKQTLDARLPHHLYCFSCMDYHRRLEPGAECLRPSFISHPVYDCPNALHVRQARARLVEGRQLPFTLIQLAARAQRYGPKHGVPLSALSKSWKCKESDWKHISKAQMWKGHIILRVISTVWVKPELTASEERLLLFSRNDYAPYFSCCDHWTHGRLVELVKCALSHTPVPRQGLRSQLKERPKIDFEKLKHPNYMPKGCEDCKPMRRCPSCPTEYMFELKLVEDKKARGLDRFKHALVVTRWSDLGDGTSPSCAEWAACNGDRQFDSFEALKTLSLCSAFEASTNNFTPNQRLMSLDNTARVKEMRGDALTGAY